MPQTLLQNPGLVLDDNVQGDPVYAGQMRYDKGAWRQRDAAGVYDPRSVYLLSHDAAALLSHYVNDWPNLGRYRVVVGAPFPSQVAWYTDATMTKLAATTSYTRNALQQATQVIYRVYAADGVTVAATATDTVTYSGADETARQRVVS